MSDKYFTVELTLGASSTGTQYFRGAPYKATLRNVSGIADGALAAGRTLTLKYGSSSKTLGVLTFSASSSGGNAATWAANSSYGADVLSANQAIKIVPNSAAGTPVVRMIWEFDKHARTDSDFA